MQKVKKSFIFMAVLSAFIGSYIGAARAQSYYYYESLPGLVSTTATTPFCESGTCTYTESEDINVALDVILQVGAPSDSNKTNTFTYSGTVDHFEATSDDQDIVDDSDLSVSGTTITIASFSGLGEVRILLTAKNSSGDTLDEDFYDITVEEKFICNSADPLLGIYDDAGTFNIGKITSITPPSSNVAKDQLLCISNYQNTTGATGDPLTASYKLTRDVYFDGASEDWDLTAANKDSEGWKLIGNYYLGYLVGWNNAMKFTGSFDGDGNVIEGLYINRTAKDWQALFGYAVGGTIKNIGVYNATILAKQTSSALIGKGESLTVSNISTSGLLKAYGGQGGGVCGACSSSTFKNIYSSVDVEGQAGATYLGGIIGYATSATISNCYSAGDVTNSSYTTGGITGTLTGSIRSCYSTGTVSGDKAGALVGMRANPGDVYTSYALNDDIDSIGYIFAGTKTSNTNHCSSTFNGAGCVPININTNWNSVDNDDDGDVDANDAVWNSLGTDNPTLKNMPF